MCFVTPPPAPRSSFTLTRPGRLLRTGLALLAVLILVSALVTGVRALGSEGPDESTATPGATADATSAVTTDAGAPTADADAPATDADAPSPGPAGPDGTAASDDPDIVRSGIVGSGTWTTAAPAVGADPGDLTVHTYAVRIEDGIGLEVEDAAREIAGILADERGWRAVDEVAFEQVDDPAMAEFTISIASPPTVDELCLPARTNGLWSCRVGEDVVLNSDRWVHLTPTYSDTSEYRTYMVNHEVGHFLGHDHEKCGGDGLTAPVMLQQSIDLGGCRPNAWPTAEGVR